ncbi:hypothetical protein U1Q18_049381 [Sarracenia purpurea var. burkii]
MMRGGEQSEMAIRSDELAGVRFCAIGDDDDDVVGVGRGKAATKGVKGWGYDVRFFFLLQREVCQVETVDDCDFGRRRKIELLRYDDSDKAKATNEQIRTGKEFINC